MRLLTPCRLRVSSVLNDDTRSYGKQHLLDIRDDTCWNSAAATSESQEQFVLMQFQEDECVGRVEMMFQGGFVARQCDICVKMIEDGGGWRVVGSVYPADCNDLQSFDLTSFSLSSCRDWAIFFRQPADFYARITLYRLNLYSVE